MGISLAAVLQVRWQGVWLKFPGMGAWQAVGLKLLVIQVIMSYLFVQLPMAVLSFMWITKKQLFQKPSGAIADGSIVFLTNGGNFIKTNSDGGIVWNKKLSNGCSYMDKTNDGGFIISSQVGNWIMKTDENGDTD